MLNRILILVTLFVYCNGRNVGGPYFRNDYEYYPEVNGWFKLHSVPMLWLSAQYQCRFEGAVLVSPLNDQLQAGITKFLKDHKTSPDVFYSGISAIFAPGIYKSVEGVNVEDMPIQWPINELAPPKGCIVFYNNGTMGSKDCNEPYPYICYKENQNVKMVRNQCGTTDNGYQLVNGTMKCYKYHSNPMHWENAYKVCYAEGARLAIISNVPDKQFGKKDTPTVYVGFKLVHGVWWDITGNRMKPYRSGETFSKGCGGINWEGQFTEVACSEYLPFLCEKDPNIIV